VQWEIKAAQGMDSYPLATSAPQILSNKERSPRN